MQQEISSSRKQLLATSYSAAFLPLSRQGEWETDNNDSSESLIYFPSSVKAGTIHLCRSRDEY